MIKSKKGIESFPFLLFLTIFIAAFVITIGFYQIQNFSEFSSHNEFVNSYKEMESTMKNLRTTTDQGSFSRVNFKVPSEHNVTFSSENNTITISGTRFNLNNSLEFDILKIIDRDKNEEPILTLEEGNYELILHYGAQNDNGNPPEPYQIYFI